MGQTNETLQKLMNREITPHECMNNLPPCSGRELEQLILMSKIPKTIRSGLKLKDVKTMNFLEVRKYCKDKVNKGINLNDLSIELDLMWENGEISGFDYRYFKESIELKISKEFICRAKSIGRYNK